VVDGEKVAVTAGLKPGEVVVTEGGDRLREGAQVTLPSSAPVAAPAAGNATAQPGKPGAPGTPGARRGRSRGKPPQSPPSQ
jgi:multidrug efflux system membrane fusion protein